MYSFCYRLLIFWLALNAVPWCASEQMERPNQPASGIPPRMLRPLAKPSGYIFAGTVTAIKSLAPQGARGVAQIQITFHVDSAVRGVRTGQSLSIREWTGAGCGKTLSGIWAVPLKPKNGLNGPPALCLLGAMPLHWINVHTDTAKRKTRQ